MKRLYIILLLTYILLSLTACSNIIEAPQDKDTVLDETESAHTVAPKDPSENSSMSISEINMETIAEAHGEVVGTVIECQDGISLDIDAVVDTSNVEQVGCYGYDLVSMTDNLRESLFAAYFGNQADEVAHNTNVHNDSWSVRKTDDIHDYYYYSTMIPISGPRVEGEERFFLYYSKSCFYRSPQNLLSTVNNPDISVSLEDILILCEDLIQSISENRDYQPAYILSFGNSEPILGVDYSLPFYRIVYAQTLDGMPVTGYQALKLEAGDAGIQKLDGAQFDVGEALPSVQIISVGEAVAALNQHAMEISWDGFLLEEEGGVEFIKENSIVAVNRIALEYIVMNDSSGRPTITPMWRFYPGSNQDEQSVLGEIVIAIDAVTGALIAERRGYWQ